MKTSFRSGALLCAFLFGSVISIFGQGSLTPPAAPMPTMKTLDQIEARTPIDATHTPGDGASLFIISAPGSYYFTGNITGVPDKNGVRIATNNVTIDLNGFALFGVSGTSAGITDVAATRVNISIKNGTITGWAGSGVNLGASVGCILSGVAAEANAGFGFKIGDAGLISHCSARYNSSDNIVTGSNANVLQCIAVGSLNGNGITLGKDSTLSDCAASLNKLAGIETATNCTVSKSAASENLGNGISAGSGSLVHNCIANQNTVDGILVTSQSVVLNNTCESNGGGSGAGIHVLTSKNRIEGNATIDNPIGYLFGGGGNLVIKNSNTGGTTPFSFLMFGCPDGDGCNSVGPRIDVWNGGNGGNITSSSPWANFLY